MLFGLPIVPSVAGVTFAAAAVVAGAPLFSRGLRSLRRRRALSTLHEAPLDELPEGFVHLTGRVGLESPLFGPLSGKRCAGFRLEAWTVGGPGVHAVEDVRPFRLIHEGVSAHVAASKGKWDLDVIEEREIGPDEELTERLEALLSEVPEINWIRKSGRSVRLVERALLSGAKCHVLGQASRTREAEWRVEEEVEWVRTGTDDGPIAVTMNVNEMPAKPELHVAAADPIDYVTVSSSAPSTEVLNEPRRRTIGLVVGPLLSLLGMLYLAAVADKLRALGAF